MQKYTREQLEAQYKKLPDALKDALFSVDAASKIYGIGRRFGLTIEKTGFMAEETGYVVLGLTRPTEFVQSLAAVLETEENKTRAIANEINNLIFFPLREALKTAHQIEIGEETQKEIIKTPPASPLPKPAPKPTLPSAPKPVPPPPAMPKAKPPTSQPPIPPSLPKSPEEKVSASPSLPVAPKIPPLDLRPQTKIRPSGLLPKPEVMGKGIFGAPPTINNIPKPEQPQTQEKPQPTAPQKSPPKSYDAYREPVE